MNVFDANCAAVQVDRANLISYTPAILQVFRSLAEVTDRVAEELRRQKQALGDRPSAIREIEITAHTAAYEFISSLGPTSNEEELSRLCTLSEQERTRIVELGRALIDNPVRMAEVEEARAKRVAELDALADVALEELSDAACEQFAGRREQRDITHNAAEVSRVAFAEQSLLSGIGTEEWRSLWESARRYSETHAYSGEAYPVVRGDAVCLLCQQRLSGDAAERLHSFEEFVKSDLQQLADKAKAAFSSAVAQIRLLSLPRSIRGALTEAGLFGSEEGEALRRFLIGAKLKRRWLLRNAAGEQVRDAAAVLGRPSLVAMRASISEELRRLRLASHAEGRRAMERERDELHDRQKVAQHQRTIKLEIERLRATGCLEAALADCKTNAITLKEGQASTLIVTNRLRSTFTANLLRLGFDATPVEVKLGAGDFGKHPYEMKLIGRPDVQPREILSEGERTCVALAGFLAELETTGNRSAIILDDPVSSLDHNYRKRVAESLVREAKARQVIVFTHDVVLLWLLRKYADELSLILTELSIERGYKGGHGRAIEGPPWVAMRIKERIKKLRDRLLKARKVLRDDGDWTQYQQLGSEIYKLLRQSWERAVEEVLLCGTVVRFGDAVQTQRLSKLTDISDADVEIVTKEMSRCSDFLHDESGVVHAEVPGPDVIDADIKRLDEWVKDLRTNRNRS